MNNTATDQLNVKPTKQFAASFQKGKLLLGYLKAVLWPESGAHSVGVTPVSIPNTEVKPNSGDNTNYGKIARCHIIREAR